jgi:hypothetical protein
MNNSPFAIDFAPNVSSMLTTVKGLTLIFCPEPKCDGTPCHITRYSYAVDLKAGDFLSSEICIDDWFPD